MLAKVQSVTGLLTRIVEFAENLIGCWTFTWPYMNLAKGDFHVKRSGMGTDINHTQILVSPRMFKKKN